MSGEAEISHKVESASVELKSRLPKTAVGKGRLERGQR